MSTPEQSIGQIANVMIESSSAIRSALKYIHELEAALNRMICAHETTLSDSEGRYPHADAGCIDCTSGTVPDRLNTGPCAYHAAKRVLGQL